MELELNPLKDNKEYLHDLYIWKILLNSKQKALIKEMIGKLDYIKTDTFYSLRVKRQVTGDYSFIYNPEENLYYIKYELLQINKKR